MASSCLDQILAWLENFPQSRDFYNDPYAAYNKYKNQLPCTLTASELRALADSIDAGWTIRGGWIPSDVDPG